MNREVLLGQKGSTYLFNTFLTTMTDNEKHCIDNDYLWNTAVCFGVFFQIKIHHVWYWSFGHPPIILIWHFEWCPFFSPPQHNVLTLSCWGWPLSSVNFFMYLLVWNCSMVFNQNSKKWFSCRPLPKLFIVSVFLHN